MQLQFTREPTRSSDASNGPCRRTRPAASIIIAISLPLLALTASSCSGDLEELSFEVSGAEYRVPRRQVLSVSLDPHQHIVIKPTAQSFELIYDSRAADRVDRFGWPVTTPISPD